MKKLLILFLALATILSMASCKKDNGEQSEQGGGSTNPPSSEHTHDYTPSVTEEATCIADGVKTFTCSCGDYYTQPIKAKGHKYVDGVCACGEKEFKSDGYTIYFKNDAGWENVSVYLWHGEGESKVEYGGAWPGAAMTKDADSSWYSCTIDAKVADGSMVIFNNGLAEGALQTGDLNFSKDNLYWTNSTAFVSMDAAEQAKAETVKVYYQNTENWENVYVSAWNAYSSVEAWPGVAMTKVDGTNDWYEGSFETYSLDGVGYQFSDGVENSGNQTGNIAYNAEKLYFSKGNLFASVDDAVNASLIEATVYFRNTYEWTAPHVHIWKIDGDSTVQINPWPGVAMTKVDGTDDWYCYTMKVVSTEGVNYVFSDGTSDGQQTGDIAYDAEKLYFSGFDSFASIEEAENAVLAETTVYFQNVDGWELPYIKFWRGENDTYEKLVGGDGVPMTKVDGTDDWYSYTIKLVSLDNIRYIFCDGSDTSKYTGNVLHNAEKLYYSNGNTYSSMEEAEDNKAVQYADLYVYGTGSYWGSVKEPFILNADGSASITIELAAGFEFKIASDDWSTMFVYSASNEFGVDSNFDWGDDYGIKVVNAGTYTFTVSADGSAVTIEKA